MGTAVPGSADPQSDGAYTPNQSYTTTYADGSTYTGHVAPTPWIARGKDNLKKFIQAGLLSVNSISVSNSTEKTDMRISGYRNLSAGDRTEHDAEQRQLYSEHYASVQPEVQHEHLFQLQPSVYAEYP